MHFDNEFEAVDFATAFRLRDLTNHSLNKTGDRPFQRTAIEQLLRHRGFRERPRFQVKMQSVANGRNQRNIVITSLAPHPNRRKIYQHFLDGIVRRTQELSQDHVHYEMDLRPLQHAFLLKLLTVELRGESIVGTLHSGQDGTGMPIDCQELAGHLAKYVAYYHAPLVLEHILRGEWRADSGHAASFSDAHRHEHLHVYHSALPYHTTIQVTGLS